MRLTVFPNWAAKVENGDLAFEASHPLLLDRLAEHFGTVTLAAAVHTRDVPGTYALLRNPGVRFRSLGSTGAGFLGRVFGYVRALPRLVRAVREADLCYIFVPGHMGLLTVLVCRCLGARYALYFRGDWAETPLPARWLRPLIFRYADFALATGREFVEETRRFTVCAEAVIPMSPLVHRYPFPPAALPRKTEGTKLLFVGELARIKGIFELVKAAEGLRKRHGFDVRLEIVGAGPDRSALEDWIDAKNMREFVTFVGLVTEHEGLRDIYMNADIFCLPTHREGFPRVLYEAMAFSLPIVASAAGQIPSVMRHDMNSLLHPPGDVPALEDCLVRLLRDTSLRERLGRAGRATIEPMIAHWGGESHGGQVLELLAVVEPRAQ